MAEPGEIVPHLQIQQVLGGEPAGQVGQVLIARVRAALEQQTVIPVVRTDHRVPVGAEEVAQDEDALVAGQVHRRATSASSSCADRKSTRLNSSHLVISYAVFCLKKKKKKSRKPSFSCK